MHSLKSASQIGENHFHNQSHRYSDVKLSHTNMELSISKDTLHFKKPARTSRGAYSLHEMYLITLKDELSGRQGIGELAPLPDLSCDRAAYPDIETVRSLAEKALPSALKGEWPDDMLQYPALRFALESAITEVRVNTPQGRISTPINGLIWMSSYDDMLEQAKQKLKQQRLQHICGISLKSIRRELATNCLIGC